MSSVTYVVALLGPSLAATAMRMLLWLPFMIGILLLLTGITAVSLLPDHSLAVVSSRRRGSHQDGHRQPLLSSPVLKAQDADSSIFKAVSIRLCLIKSILTSHKRNFSLLLATFFLTALASSDTKLLVQYISVRFHWTIASAGYLLSCKAVVNFVLLTVVIPRVLRWRAEVSHIDRLSESSDKANIRYAKLCLVISVFGALLIACSAAIWFLIPSLLVYALGSALPIFTLSLLKSPLVAPVLATGTIDHTLSAEAFIFSLVMLVKTLSSLLGAPLMTIVWVAGIEIGGAALGSPYFLSAVCYCIATLVFSKIEVD
jgi:hypothetical protein